RGAPVPPCPSLSGPRLAGVLECHDLPAVLGLRQDEDGTRLALAHRGAEVRLATRIVDRDGESTPDPSMDERDGHVRAHEPHALDPVLGPAALVDGREDVPMTGLDGRAPLVVVAQDVDEVGVLGKRGRPRRAVRRVPGRLAPSHDVVDRCFVVAHRGHPSGRRLALAPPSLYYVAYVAHPRRPAGHLTARIHVPRQSFPGSRAGPGRATLVATL